MAVRPITVIPRDGAVLRAHAKRVPGIDRSLLRLVEDMIDSMHAASGVGLAAPQIGVSLRLVVIGMPGEPPFGLVNPEIVKRSGERRISEGCLSVPGYRAEVARSERVVVKATDLKGRELRLRAEGDLLAQALEHEINHLNGILYIDQVDDPASFRPVPSSDEWEQGSDDAPAGATEEA
jgi:peptide deformylase